MPTPIEAVTPGEVPAPGDALPADAAPPPIEPPADIESSAPLPASDASPVPLPPALPEEQLAGANTRDLAATPRRFRYAFSVVVREVYDDNINLSQSAKESDFYTSIEPRIRLGFGETGEGSKNSISFVYAPSLVFYADHSEANALQHVIHLDAQRVFGKLSGSVTIDIGLLNGSDIRSLTDSTGRQANIDVGGRSRQHSYSTKLALSYDLSSKTFLSGGVDYSRSDYPSQALSSSEVYTGNLFLNYNYSPKLVIGLGTTGGYTQAENAPSQNFEQANLRLSFNPGEKLGFLASVGYEFRQAQGGSGSSTSPVFDLSAVYKPFDGTNISLDGSRRTQSSASVAGSDYAETDLHFTVQQRFFQRIFASLSGGYQNLAYFNVSNGSSLSRSDDYYYFQVALDGNITRFWDAGVYYLHREDMSAIEAFSFSDNQVGLRTSFTF